MIVSVRRVKLEETVDTKVMFLLGCVVRLFLTWSHYKRAESVCIDNGLKHCFQLGNGTWTHLFLFLSIQIFLISHSRIPVHEW